MDKGADMELDMVADTEVDKVADMELDMVADMEEDKVDKNNFFLNGQPGGRHGMPSKLCKFIL